MLGQRKWLGKPAAQRGGWPLLQRTISPRHGIRGAAFMLAKGGSRRELESKGNWRLETFEEGGLTSLSLVKLVLGTGVFGHVVPHLKHSTVISVRAFFITHGDVSFGSKAVFASLSCNRPTCRAKQKLLSCRSEQQGKWKHYGVRHAKFLPVRLVQKIFSSIFYYFERFILFNNSARMSCFLAMFPVTQDYWLF